MEWIAVDLGVLHQHLFCDSSTACPHAGRTVWATCRKDGLGHLPGPFTTVAQQHVGTNDPLAHDRQERDLVFLAAGGQPLAENLHVRIPAGWRQRGNEQTVPRAAPAAADVPCALPLSRLNVALQIRLAASRLPTCAIFSAFKPRKVRLRIKRSRMRNPVAVWRCWLELRIIACERRRNLLAESSRNVLGVVCRVPEGAFHSWAYFDHPAITSAQIFDFRLEEARVASVPGEAYGLGGGHCVQFSLATSEDLLQEAAERIGVAMKHAMEGISARPAIPERGSERSFRHPAPYRFPPHR